MTKKIKVNLIDATPIGIRRSFAHINKGNRLHEFDFMEFNVYDDYPDGIRLRLTRRELKISLVDAARLLGLKASEVSQLEFGRKILDPEISMDYVIGILEKR